MSIQTTQRLESAESSNNQATISEFEQPTATLSIGEVDDSGAENGVDRRVERAITEFFHVVPVSATEWLVESGSGSRYIVDLYDPDEPECNCEDSAKYCKHVWRIFLFACPKFLTDRIYGLGTGR